MNATSVISLLGGLAFFLFGMSLMGDGLKKVAGSRLETILARLTSTPLKGVLLGTFVTAIIQSSSATTVMVVGFVNSGIMKLSQAIGIIMGANIGTTATGWILSLSGVDGGGSIFSTTFIFAVVAIIGILFYMISHTTQRKNVGVILLSLSVLMSGMKTMSSAMEPLQESEGFLRAITAISNPLVCIIFGIAVTAVIQSCSASIGILQALSITGVINYSIAIPMVVGMSIGAAVPVLLSAIGANKNGKRAAFTYLYFNIIGGTVFMAVYGIVNAVTGGLPLLDATASSVGIAIVNTVFKVFAVVVEFPMIPLLEKLAVATFKDVHDEDEEVEVNLLDERFLDYPPLAVEQSGKTVELMANAARKNFIRSIELLNRFDKVKFDKVMGREDVVDRYEDRLGTYLVRLNAKELSMEETKLTSKYLHALSNLERISDHAVNIAELGQEISTKGLSFSKAAGQEIDICVEAVREIVDLAYDALVCDNLESAHRVEPLEEVIDVLTEELKVQHINRLQTGQCTLEMGFVFNDCVNNFERVADHCSNIAVSVIELHEKKDMEAHDYLRSIKENDDESFRAYLKEYENKYCTKLAEKEQLQEAELLRDKEQQAQTSAAADAEPAQD